MAFKIAGNGANQLLAPSSKCWALLKQFEGERLAAYQDIGGCWTIGYGHTAGVKRGDVCSVPQALAWLFTDTADAARAVRLLVNVTLTGNQFDALTALTFNIGTGAFHKSHLLAFLNGGDEKRAIVAWRDWDHVDGRVVSGLASRRAAEIKLFCTL